MLGQIFRYLKYRTKAKNRYKIHSPFAYGFLNNVLREKKYYDDFKILDSLTRELMESDKIIETVDYGAGGKGKEPVKYKTTLGKVAKRRSHPLKRLHLLYNLSAYLKPSTMLELGTAVGISSMYLKKPVPESKMITVEGCPVLASIARENFRKAGLKNIDVIAGNFDEVLDDVLQKFDKLDFVFFDGNHKKEPTLDYFNKCVEKSHPGTVFLFDDIHWSGEMEQAWERIKADERVSVTMDIFWFGFVFFRKGIAKQDFVVKY